jgi:hypothetical protein
MYLRQSTASQEIKLGPFLDSTDGVTPMTALTVANTDIKLTFHGTTAEASKNSGGATHIASGRYGATLDATDTATLGNLEIDVAVSGALPVHRTYTVLPANVFDSLILGTDTLDVQVTGMGAGVVTAAAVATGAIDADAIATDAVTEIQSGLATAAALSTVAGYIDTEVAAIKAKTDSLTFTVAGVVDANIQRINDVAITGDGQAGTEFNV